MIFYNMIESLNHIIILNPFAWTFLITFLSLWFGMFIESKIRFWGWSEICKACKETTHWDHIAIHCKACYNEICLNKENK